MKRENIIIKFAGLMILLLIYGQTVLAGNFWIEPQKGAFLSPFLYFNLINTEQDIFNLINNERKKNRLIQLEWDDKLAKIARTYSKKMARESFFSHFDRDGKTVKDRINDADVKGWKSIGENLFYSQGLDDYSEFAVKGWMRSPTHRRNILERSYTATGIGIAESGTGEIYITQIFIGK